MTEKNLTEWFPNSTKPIRKGVYQVKGVVFSWLPYAYWNGKRFCYRAESVDRAHFMKDEYTDAPESAQWRGIAK